MKLRVTKLRGALILALLLTAAQAWAQNTMGMSGLISVPTGSMRAEGDAQITTWYLGKDLTPNQPWTYDTGNLSLSITPFWWCELAYTMTLMRDKNDKLADKDRALSVKIMPLREGKWWPAVAIGGNDVIGSGFRFRGEDTSGNSFWSNGYVALSKHFTLWGQELGTHLAYRHAFTKPAKDWQGVVGGIDIRPSFWRDLRFVAEYTGREVNIGADCVLWRHLVLQVALGRCQHLSGCIAYRTNLF